METSCRNLAQENQDVVRDLMAEDEEPVGTSQKPSALHILDLPDSVIFQILVYLPFSSIGAVAQVCGRFCRICSDELLWRHVFLQHYKLPVSTTMPAKARSWRKEFKRLYYHTPAVLSEERKEHKDEVLHVSFSHDGTMFATCSKDGFFKVWECTHPVRLLFKMDMKTKFSWKFTQFSQFNETDTCLLVSGVYFGRLSTSGEIAVFNLQDDFNMQCRVTNKPYDVFGAWYDNDHLLSGTLYWTGDFNSVSAVWLSKASQEVESEVESVSMVLYRFENVNSSSIRLLHVAEIDRDSDATESSVDKEELEATESGQTSPHGSSIGFGDEGKISMDFDSSKNRPEVENKAHGRGKMPVKESCMLDKLLQKHIAEDEFDLDNEDKTDNDDEGDEHMESETTGANDLTYQGNGRNIFPFLGPDRLTGVSEVTFDLRGADDEQGDGTCEYRNSQSIHYFGLKSPEKLVSSSHALTKANCLSAPKNTANSGNRTSTLSSTTLSFASGSTGVNQPSILVSKGAYDNPFDGSSNTTHFDAKIAPAQEIESEQPCFDSSDLGPSQLSLLEFLSDRTDQTVSASSSRNCHEHFSRSTNIFSTSSNVDSMPESAMEVVSENDGVQKDNLALIALEDVSASFCSTDRTLSLANITPDDVCEGACASAIECPSHNHNNLLMRNSNETADDLGGSPEKVNAGLDVASVSENKTNARDVSQQFGHGFDSRDSSMLNVPSMFDNNLVMLIPGASHVYGSRTCSNSARNGNSNTSNASNNASYEAEGISGVDNTVINVDMLLRDAGTSQNHKSSIATQTEVASSRASSFHSLSHMSQSSSISRDFRCSPPKEKLLIYTWGSETYIPHKVGIKRMKWTDFTKGEVTARRSSMLLPDVMENLHNMAGNRRDKPDVTIEMHGHIVGLSLSPDHKFLYVNCRPWPKNYIISDPQESPPLAQEVEISTIDLTNFNFVGPVLRSHKAYTHSDECFFLNLDVSDDYVASGAEDRQGYLWDRHYGIPLYRFPHRNVVNCVAINPQDSEILVTVSDDYTFKVWMSRCRASELTGSNDEKRGTSV